MNESKYERGGASPQSNGFRDTPLGPLPEDWQVVRLGEIFDIKQGKSLSPKHRSGVNPQPFLRTANVYWGKIDLSHLDKMDFTVDEMRELSLKRGDLLVCEGGEIGRTAIWDGQIQICFYQNHIHRLRTTNENVHPPFYMYWMQAAYGLLGLYGGTGNKTTIPNLSQSRLKSFLLPLPPLPEQRAIARVLTAIQRAIEATEQVIAATRELKKSLMRHLFTYGPVPVGARFPVGAQRAVPQQETEIGSIPAHWQVVRLGSLLEEGILLIRNGFPQGEHNISGQGVPHLRPFNINNDGCIDLAQIKYISPPCDASPYWLQKGDVIFNNTNSEELVGKTAYFSLDGRYVLSNHMTFIRVLNLIKVDAYWLARHLHWLWMQDVFRGLCRRHVNQASVSLERLKGVAIPLPPLSEQRAIAEMLRAVDEKIQAEENRKAALQSLFRSMLHHLMTGKVRVWAQRRCAPTMEA